MALILHSTDSFFTLFSEVTYLKNEKNAKLNFLYSVVVLVLITNMFEEATFRGMLLPSLGLTTGEASLSFFKRLLMMR